VQTDAVVEELVALREQELAQEQHERVDLVLGPGPVLLAERIQREGADAEAARGADRTTHGVGPFAVPLPAREPALLGPAAVAIHDDADVAGEVSGFDE
jgi:hypothetical protein